MIEERIDRTTWEPIAIGPKENLESLVRELLEKHPGLSVVDQYEKNLEELFLLRNPACRFEKNYQEDFERFKREHYGAVPKEHAGMWFYFPWANSLVHYLVDEMHQELRTGRNKLLITEDEQKRFYSTVIGVLGMSVGSHIALTIAMTGGGKGLRLADPDTLSGDNLNRIRTGYGNVGTNKAIAVAREIAVMNPYAAVRVYPEGLGDNNVSAMLDDLDVLVEEMDNPYWKLRIREEARKKGIPVVMGTDNGDGIIVDIERYDVDQTIPILNGLAKGISAEEFRTMNPRDLPRVTARIAGANLAVPRMLDSVAEVGTSLYSWPQLGTAATMCGSVIAYLARRIALRDPSIKSGRYQVNVDSIFESGYRTPWKTFSRKKSFFDFVKKMKKRNQNPSQ